MDNVTRLRTRFERDTDDPINWFGVHRNSSPTELTIIHPAYEPVTEPIPAILLDPIPTTSLDLYPEPVHKWHVSWWMFVLGVTVGMVTMAILLRNL